MQEYAKIRISCSRWRGPQNIKKIEGDIAMADRMPVETKNLDIYGHDPLPWSRPRDLLAGAIFFGRPAFLGTVGPDGRPHAAGVGALWLDGDIYFTSSPKAPKARNLAANPACTLSASLATIDMVFEGEAVRITDTATLERLAARHAGGSSGKGMFR
jgi:hypothetical protein